MTAASLGIASSRRRSFRPVADQFEARVLLSDLLVTNTGDSAQVPGSLRFAILQATAGDRILFQIPAADPNFNPVTGSWTIPVGSPLPPLGASSVEIDGLSQQSQTGASTDHPVIEITPAAPFPGDGLTVASSNNTVRGLVIDGFQGNGIFIAGETANNLVTGDFLGTDVTGTAALGNGLAGVRISGTGNTIANNVISGNLQDGIFIFSSGNLVLRNFIGTDAAGVAALGNGGNGVFVNLGFNNEIGGVQPVQGNIIANNGQN